MARNVFLRLACRFLLKLMDVWGYVLTRNFSEFRACDTVRDGIHFRYFAGTCPYPFPGVSQKGYTFRPTR
uniref:Putative secreted protein n=1 Tax=Anopheles darlingi TaxID=43151 RepID=A0A2M4D3U1_ANODA